MMADETCEVCHRTTLCAKVFSSWMAAMWVCTDRADCLAHRPDLASCP